MRKNELRRLDETYDDKTDPFLHRGYVTVKAMAKMQVEEARANLDYAERRYLRAKQEMKEIEASYAQLCEMELQGDGV
ncbi:hypothetical protein [Metabacillus sp. SLBN-84]